MKGIYAAVRSSFRHDQRLFQGRDPASSMSYAFMNALSLGALDEKQVDKFLVFTNTDYSEDESLITNIVSQLGVEREKIIIRHSQDYSIEQLIDFLKTLAKSTRNIMVGAVSVVAVNMENDSSSTHPEDILNYFSHGKHYINTDFYQNELFPLDVSQGIDQEEFLVDDFNKTPSLEVRRVNGVASILLKADQDFPSYHHFPLIQIEHLSFEKEDIASLAKVLKNLAVNEQWIVEIDYLSFEDLIDFKNDLYAHDIELPEMKSGGSIFYGNSSTLNGLRAISSAMAQLEHRPEGKAIALALTERNSMELCVLNYTKEETELD